MPADSLSKAYAHGRFEVEANGPFFVSRHIGCSTLPLRINAPPKLILRTVMSNEL